MKNKGFSMVELIIVIAIMMVLAGVLAPMLLKYIKKSKEAHCVNNREAIKSEFDAQCAEGNVDLDNNEEVEKVLNDVLARLNYEPADTGNNTFYCGCKEKGVISYKIVNGQILDLECSVHGKG